MTHPSIEHCSGNLEAHTSDFFDKLETAIHGLLPFMTGLSDPKISFLGIFFPTSALLLAFSVSLAGVLLGRLTKVSNFSRLRFSDAPES